MTLTFLLTHKEGEKIGYPIPNRKSTGKIDFHEFWGTLLIIYIFL